MAAYNDPEIQVLTIADFTPGVYAFGRGSYSLSSGGTAAPEGSACQSYRCYAKKGVGLIPFPTYKAGGAGNGAIFQPSTLLQGTGDLSIGGMRAVMVNGIGTPPMQDILVLNTLAQPTNTSGQATFQLNYLSTTTLGVIFSQVAYSNSSAVLTGNVYPGILDTSFFQYGTPPQPVRSVVCVDTTQLLQGQVVWALYPAWDGTHVNGTLTLNPALFFNPTPKVFYVNGRTCFTFLGTVANPIAGFNNNAADAVYVTDVQAMTVTSSNTFNPNYYYPELGVDMGSWGTMSDGEFFFVYRGGGGVLIYGDINAPSSVTKLPGIVGTGAAIGAGVETAAGLVYVTDLDGAYLWNGGNTSQKISDAIPDDVLYRTTYPGYCNVHNDVWGQWYMAANNWMWDIETGGWWQVEDPNVFSFQMHCASVASLDNFYSSDGYTHRTGSGQATLNVWSWQRNLPQSNYTWTMTPMANPGQLVDFQWFEICASNPSSTACTITVQPTAVTLPSRSGTALPTPNFGVVGPPVMFTIPPATLGYRESARMGYSDYNLTVRVTANNPGPAFTNPAPILHELTLGYNITRPSGGGN